MIGLRTMLFGGLVVLAVALGGAQRQEPLVFDWVDAGNGLKVMRHEVTVAQWRQCVNDGVCSFVPRAEPAARDDSYPVTGISALDAQEFVTWARGRTGLPVRLPTLEEWYRFSGVPPSVPTKIFTDPRLAWAASYGSEGKVDPMLKRAGSFGHTARGVADVHGNVWEWTSSCVVENGNNRCPAYFAAGEHEAKLSIFIRDPASGGCATGSPPAHLGVRLVWGPAG